MGKAPQWEAGGEFQVDGAGGVGGLSAYVACREAGLLLGLLLSARRLAVAASLLSDYWVVRTAVDGSMGTQFLSAGRSADERGTNQCFNVIFSFFKGHIKSRIIGL
jgi:hypothetical protein